MKDKSLIVLLGLALGVIVGTTFKSQRIAIGGYQALQSTSFTVATVFAYAAAAMFAVIYAKWPSGTALFFGVAMFAIALTWSL